MAGAHSISAGDLGLIRAPRHASPALFGARTSFMCLRRRPTYEPRLRALLVLAVAWTLKAADAANAYLRVGDGACLAQAAMPVQGVSARDVDHSKCRSLCSEACVGYSYRPCARSCTLHGDPAQLALGDVWAKISGGSKIVESSEQCGEACFARMNPCPGGIVESSGVEIPHPQLEFDSSIFASCPKPYFGRLELRCGLFGIQVLGGRCKEPCPPGKILDGSFLVEYDGIIHGQEITAPCPGTASGEIIMSCLDGEAKKERGRCGFNCDPASVRAGKAAVLVGSMLHNKKVTLGCPTGFSGRVTMECVNGMTSLFEGMCQKNCEAGEIEYYVGGKRGIAKHGFIYANQDTISSCEPSSEFTGSMYLDCVDGEVIANTTRANSQCYLDCHPGLIGPAVKAVAYPRIDHDTSVNLICNSDAVGVLEVACTNGTASIAKGVCLMHCPAATLTSNRMQLSHPYARNGTNVTVSCPNATHNGNLTLECNDGIMDLVGGYCGINCPGGYLINNWARVDYQMVRHGNQDYFPCPAPYVGEVFVRCYDGTSRFGGFCGGQCAGKMQRFAGAVLNYPTLNHTKNKTLPCDSEYPDGGLQFTGEVTVICNNRKVEFDGSCQPDCGSSMIKDNGSPLWYPLILAGKSTEVVCDPGSIARPSFGIVTLTCTDGFAKVTKGTCGAPCPAGIFSSLLTRFEDIKHEEVMHLTDVWFDCPTGLSGRVQLSCRDGSLSLTKGSCGERCPAKSRKLYGVSFVSPQMEHEATFIRNCTMPFEGYVHLYCEKGHVTITNKCRSGCFAGDAIVPGGKKNASIEYPDMTDSTFFSATCPKNFAGRVTLQCWDGTPRVHNGSCHSFCDAGRWTNNVVELVHYNMVHEEEKEMNCPATFSGTITLECDSGFVKQKAGNCFKDCDAGSMFIRAGVKMEWTDAIHEHVYPVQPCPSGYFGSVWQQCWDGKVRVKEGECFAHCGNGTTPQGAIYGGLSHATNSTVPCPEIGTNLVGCVDGRVTVLGGTCVYHCDAGSLKDENDVVVEYPAFTHDANVTAACTGFAVGSRTVVCNNRNVSFANRTLALKNNPGEGCSRHCNATVLRTRDEKYVLRSNSVDHGQKADVNCPEGVLGVVTLQCTDSKLTHIDGECGDANCKPSEITSGEAVMPYNLIGHERRDAVECPVGFEGNVTLFCKSSEVTIEEVAINTGLPTYSPSTTAAGRAASRLELGEDPFSNRIKLCECCKTPVPPPGTKPIPARNMWTIIYWAAAAGFVFFMSASLGGIYYLRYMRPRKMKLSSVAPAPETVVKPSKKNNVLANDVLAIEDKRKQLELEDSSPPPKAKPFREPYQGEWNWG